MTKLEKLKSGAGKRWDRLAAREVAGAISWSWVDAEDLKSAAVAATEDGAALLLSKTSDGGALVIQVWSGAGRHKLYPTTMEELTDTLALIGEIGNA